MSLATLTHSERLSSFTGKEHSPSGPTVTGTRFNRHLTGSGVPALPVNPVSLVDNETLERAIARLRRMAGSLIQVGQLNYWPTNNIPGDWLLCDGSDFDAVSYPELYDLIGDTFNTFRGAIDPGSGRFRVPDYRGLMLTNSGTPGSLSDDLPDPIVLHAVGGKQKVVLSLPDLPSHNHDVVVTIGQAGAHNHFNARFCTFSSGVFNLRQEGGSAESSGMPFQPDHTHTTTTSQDSFGGGGPHDNLPPMSGVNVIIKAL